MNVLIPVDGSKACDQTLDWVASSFDKGSARYFLLLVIPKSFPEVMIEADPMEEAVQVLKEARWFMENRGCEVERAEYVLGDPVDGICRYADEMNVDQILIGSHGRSASTHAGLGRISTGVFERCDKPVFIFRNIYKQQPVPSSKHL